MPHCGIDTGLPKLKATDAQGNETRDSSGKSRLHGKDVPISLTAFPRKNWEVVAKKS